MTQSYTSPKYLVEFTYFTYPNYKVGVLGLSCGPESIVKLQECIFYSAQNNKQVSDCKTKLFFNTKEIEIYKEKQTSS